MSEHDLDRVIPPDLRAAIADGWEGVTLLADAPAEQPVTVVCAARAGRLGRMGGCAFTVADAAAGGAPGRLLVLAIEEAPEGAEAIPEDGCPAMSVGIDLAYPEARALVERACASGGMRIAWVPAGGDAAEPPRCQAIELGASGCAALRAAMARVAEWHTGAPVPLGVSTAAWAAARRSPPRLIEGSFAEGRVALVVPARTLWGVESQGGRVAFASSLIGAEGRAPAGPDGDLELRFVWDGAAPVVRRVSLGLGEPGQRRLAARLADQRQMIVMSVEDGSVGPQAHVRVSLGPLARSLVLRATLAAERRHEAGGEAGGRSVAAGRELGRLDRMPLQRTTTHGARNAYLEFSGRIPRGPTMTM